MRQKTRQKGRRGAFEFSFPGLCVWVVCCDGQSTSVLSSDTSPHLVVRFMVRFLCIYLRGEGCWGLLVGRRLGRHAHSPLPTIYPYLLDVSTLHIHIHSHSTYSSYSSI
jgi:hypothetical protein